MKTIDTTRLKSYNRKHINNLLYDLTYNKYFPSIPISDILDTLNSSGIDIYETDFILCGADGNTTFEIKDILSEKGISNSILILCWHKMQSGNYEIVTYLS
jgi:hypothetical protein